MKYAAGGLEDRLDNYQQNHKNKKTTIITGIIALAFLIWLALPAITPNSIKVINKRGTYNETTKVYEFSFEIKNNAFGPIFFTPISYYRFFM